MAGETPEGKAVRLQVVTPSGLCVDADADMATLSGLEGDFGVLYGHTPFFTTLRPGVLRYAEGGMPRAAAVSAGFVEVTGEKVIVLARTCEKGGQVDSERARRSKKEAEEKLGSMSAEDEQREYYETRLARAEARLEVASGRKEYGG
ncbi:MAG: ATP synthase F1 subunit epsilon [Candidatus Nitrospinota bacterium M3_3B_026]